MEKINKITMAGSGAFGTAVAEALAADKTKDREIVIFGIDEGEVNDINENHKNTKYFGEVELTSTLTATTDAAEAFKDADIIMIAVPSFAIGTALEKSIVPNMTKPAYIVNLSKGFDFESLSLLSEKFKSSIPEDLNLGVFKLAGASFATELVRKLPTPFILASNTMEASEDLYEEFTSEHMITTPIDSLEAVEWMSVIKNPMAILQGLIAGLGYETNTKALFFMDAFNEVRNFINFLGYNPEVVFTAGGIGDFFLTCTSPESRNYSVGFLIGKADEVTDDILNTYATVEGVRSIKVLYDYALEKKINLKCINLLYNLIYKKEKPTEAIKKHLKNF